MQKIKMNLFAKYAVVLGLNFVALSLTHASVTKVGNGNDGADLENLTQLTSGPIVEARQRAIEKVKQLNVMGVPGLGLLIPELEHSTLFMAAQDAHPTGEQQGSLEIAADKGFVYARTFAEPYAATRFFPAAEALTGEQLVALHIHEALHRALPSDVRTDENKVMHLTLAMTSPGASYDRVQQVASHYINSDRTNTALRSSTQLNSTVNVAPLALPGKSRTEINIGTETYNEMKTQWATHNVVKKLELNTSLGGYKQLGSFAVEPAFRVRVTLFQARSHEAKLGPTSFDLEGRVKLDDHTMAGPFLRFTAKSLDGPTFTTNERDLTTVGAFYRNNAENSYFESAVSYAFASTAGDFENTTAQYNSILSFTGRTGLKWKRFAIGGLFGIHDSAGRELSLNEQGASLIQTGYPLAIIPGRTRSRFRIVAAGPEVGIEGKTLQFKLYGKQIMNEPKATFDDLGDTMDHGGGEQMTGMSLTMAF